jgi:type I restriction enzyme S subunit
MTETLTVKQLSSFIKTGKTPPTKHIKYFDGVLDWFTPGDLDKGKLLGNSQRTLTSLALEEKKAISFPAGTLLVACIGNIGKIGITSKESSSNQQLTGIKPNSDVDVEYLYYWFKKNKQVIQHYSNNAVVPILNNKTLAKIKVFVPPLPVQQKIATILDIADALTQKDKALIGKYAELSQSLFLDMFGDPVINPNKWPSKRLDTLASIASGVTKGRKMKADKFIELPYMRVANVQDGYLDLSEIKTIPGVEKDLSRYGLKMNDILLTEGGDPDKLGRGAIWHDEIKHCIHQNHIFRVRLTDKKITPMFFSKLCGSTYGKRYFLKSGKQTTGIASINKTQLSNFPALLPPIDLQNQFAERIQAIEQQKQQAEASLQKSEDLFNCLLQKAFKGELVT